MWVLLLMCACVLCAAGQQTFLNTYSYNTTSCSFGSLVAVRSNRTACTRAAGPCVNGLVVSCESIRPQLLALTVSKFSGSNCNGEAVTYESYAANMCYNTPNGESELVQCQGNRIRVDRYRALGCSAARFNSTLVATGCTNAAGGAESTQANSCQGWCPNCSYAEGVWVAVSIALISLGALLGIVFAIWGIRKTRARRALALWPHSQEHTHIGDMVSMDLSLIKNGLPDED